MAEKRAHTTCYMCACRCGITVTLRDDKIRFIQGTPESPVNQGVICAKGSAGIMTEIAPSRLRKPMKRMPGTERGEGKLVEIEWEEALELALSWLRPIRESDPRKMAFYTGRDQMQTFTGFWARQFGTPNWAAHGGFCAVNHAAGGMYSMGGSYWEFGFPDLERTKFFMLIGVAEDHPANALKLAMGRLKDQGARFVTVNPVRTGYSAIADEWVPIRPGTDAAFLLAMAQVLVEKGLYDRYFLQRYTNAAHLVIDAPGTSEDGLVLRRGEEPLVWDEERQEAAPFSSRAPHAALFGVYEVDGRRVRPSFQILVDRLNREYTPAQSEEITGISANVVRRLATEMGVTAMRNPITLPIPWVDAWGEHHPETIGRPVSFHSMRGLAAHSNGFQSIRALHVLMMILGAIDNPGSFGYKSPYPKASPPPVKPAGKPHEIVPGAALPGPLLGYPTSPDDLLMEEDSDTPVRLDHAFSWEYPLSAHGTIQNVIRNAATGNPYPIDTLMIYMANMAWNSSWNTVETRAFLKAKDEAGNYKIPHLIVFDAYHSETVAFADLVFPDTTYFERYDAMSLLDRPISEPHGPADAMRHPVLPPPPGVRSTADTLVELANRLHLPRFVDEQGNRLYANWKEFIEGWETEPGSGVGLLAGFRGKDGQSRIVGEPNPHQIERYIENKAFWYEELPSSRRYFRMGNKAYLEWASEKKFIGKPEPIVLNLYSEPLQRFRLAGQGLWPGRKPKSEQWKKRLVTYFDPLPFWYAPLEHGSEGNHHYPLRVLTQRPMPHYHSWGSQNVWLRQLLAQNVLYVNAKTAAALGLEDGGYAYMESRINRVKVQIRFSEAVNPETVWTWNAVAKGPGAWGLSPDAPEARKSFLVNHVIPDLLTVGEGEEPVFNCDPITGQAAWYDTRVRLIPAKATDPTLEFEAIEPLRPEAAKSKILVYGER